MIRRKGKDDTTARNGRPMALGIVALEDNLSVDKGLAAMKPEERRVLVARAKLAPALFTKLEAFHKTAHAISKVVEVQIWVSSQSLGSLAQLKALGFKLEETLTPGRLLLGTVAINKLDGLLKLTFVRRVETPKFK